MRGLFTPSVTLVLVLSLALAGVPVSAAPALGPAAESTGARLVILSKLAGSPLPENLGILEDYGAFVLAAVPDGQAIALSQDNVMDWLPERTVISLNGTIWDTRKGEPSIPASLRSAVADPYFLVQFYGPVKEEWVANLESLGVTFLGYHPNFTYIVRMDPALLPGVQAAHAVQWVGRYHPAYRLASEAELATAERDQDGRMALQVSGFPDGDAAALRAGLEKAGATLWLVESVEPPVIRVSVAPELLTTLAALPGIYRVEAYDEPSTNNDKGVQTAHTWDVWKQGRNGLLQDLMGAGQIAGIVDSGLDNKSTTPTIEDFFDYTGGTATSRVVYNQNGAGCNFLCPCTSSDTDGHGTHTAGSIVANGYNSLAQRGLVGQATAADPSFDYAWGTGQAPEAKIAVIHAGGTSGGICVSASTDWTTLYNQGARNASNSWGDANYTYGTTARNADTLMWTYQDYLIVVAAGNTGPTAGGAISRPANAKNILSVGGAYNHRPSTGWYGDTASLLTYFSARGPVSTGTTGDTRFKPDIVAPGAMVLSTRSNQVAAGTDVGWGNEAGIDGGDGDGDNDGRPDYAWMGGTSMSTPQVTGAATIVRDYFQDIQGFATATPPSAALIKAALLNGAVDMGYGYEAYNSSTRPSGQVHYGGRNMQGWGFLNVEQAITPRAPRSFFFDDFTNITNSTHQSTMGTNGTGDYVEYTVAVADSSEPLKVTLTWTDYQDGNDSYAVNNLNLLVTAPAPGSTAYYGNNFSGSWSVTGGAYDTKNNTEAVYLQSPAAGTWTIRVTDAAHGSGTQPFALYVSGGLGVNPSWTRTCSGTAGTCANARAGTSGQTFGGTAINYFPSLKPLNLGLNDVAPARFRLTNWGRSSDSISLSYAVTDKTGAAASGITIAFDQTSPIALASGASQDVVATVSVGGGVSAGAYDVLVTATSANTGNRKDAIVIPLTVVAGATLANQNAVVSLSGAQVSSDFWASGSTLWAAYLSGEDHINDEGEVWASCSTDGGVTWTNVGQVDSGDGAVYYGPVVAGNSDSSSVTFVWIKPNLAVYARTWTQTSGCTGTWRDIQPLATYPGGDYRLSYPDVTYDTDGTILAVWRKNDNASGGTDGIFSSQSTNDGVSWTTAAGVPNASGTDAAHIMPQLTLDTNLNQVWMAYQNSANGGDIYLKRWVGSTNAWDAAGTNHIAVATTADVEIRPGIGYVAATNSLWVTWHRYSGVSNPSARLYYVRSTGTLPTVTWGTTYQYPVGVRTAEEYAAMVVGDSANAYITYETQSDGFRGQNIYALVVPAAGGAPGWTYQLSATADDPPLYGRGNAGSPRLMWATTTVNGIAITGPTLLYSKNPPENQVPDYTANLGVAQTLFNLEENFHLYLVQIGTSNPTAARISRFTAAVRGDGVVVEWETTSELDNLGFNLYRAQQAGGPRALLNDVLIPGAVAPGSSSGASYRYVDTASYAGKVCFYWLEMVGIDGHSTWHGPLQLSLTAVPGK